jgi:hypothetical protein
MVVRDRSSRLPPVVQGSSYQGTTCNASSASGSVLRAGSRAGLSRASGNGSGAVRRVPSVGTVKGKLLEGSANERQPNDRLQLSARGGRSVGKRSFVSAAAAGRS